MKKKITQQLFKITLNVSKNTTAYLIALADVDWKKQGAKLNTSIRWYLKPNVNQQIHFKVWIIAVWEIDDFLTTHLSIWQCFLHFINPPIFTHQILHCNMSNFFYFWSNYLFRIANFGITITTLELLEK